MPGRLAVALTAIAACWTLVIATAPLALGRGDTVLAAVPVYAAASQFCHQRPERTFSIGGQRMPVCARCSGLYVSGALGALMAWIPRGRRRTSARDRAILVICALPTALTWGLEFAGVTAFSNGARALAALPLGLAAGWIFVRALRDEAAPAAAGISAPPAIS